MLQPGIRELATRVFEELMGRQLPPRSVDTAFTPRRLVLTVKGLTEGEPDREEEVIGPPVAAAFDEDGEPKPAALGFAKRCGVEVGELNRVRTEKGEYLAAVQRTEGRPTVEVLAEMVPRVLAGLSWPKVMRWGSDIGPWVRPVHGIVALFGGEVVPFELFGVRSGKVSAGHAWLAPEEFEVTDAADYQRKMARRRIVLKFENRSRKIRQEMAAMAKARDAQPVEDAPLLDKLASICEIPGVVEGSFDERFLELPREVLVTSLRDHQSAFGVESSEGLQPRFLTVMDRADDPEKRVRTGNEWVVAARLEDARFFYQEDRKRSLKDRVGDLEALTFHVKLGIWNRRKVFFSWFSRPPV
jgi:glycyl-tRNA synthetase beta chain